MLKTIAFAGAGPTTIYSNIASIDIPPLEQPLVEWLQAQPPARLTALGVDTHDIGDRTFYSRLALGEFTTSFRRCSIARGARGSM